MIERILGIRLLYLRNRVARQVNFDFMNQQLAWMIFSDFLLFFLPMINFSKIQLWWFKLLQLVPGIQEKKEQRG